MTTEILAAILGAISVWFVVRRNVWAFPIGMVMVVLYGWIFYQSKLYSDMLLQGFFFVFQIQGWMDWSKSDKASDDKIVIRRFSMAQWGVSALIMLCGTLLLGTLMDRYTDADLPWFDAFTAVMSMVAQWWMNKRFLENWILWIIVDFIYLFIYYYKNLHFTTFLYLIFLIMAIIGYYEWRKKAPLPN